MDHLNRSYLYHHGIKGQKWGIRRYQNPDGTLTDAGRKRYARDIANAKMSRPEIVERVAKDLSRNTSSELKQRLKILHQSNDNYMKAKKVLQKLDAAMVKDPEYKKAQKEAYDQTVKHLEKYYPDAMSELKKSQIKDFTDDDLFYSIYESYEVEYTDKVRQNYIDKHADYRNALKQEDETYFAYVQTRKNVGKYIVGEYGSMINKKAASYSNDPRSTSVESIVVQALWMMDQDGKRR